MMSVMKAFNQPFGILWRTALVRLPRAVPDAVLFLTTPEGPYPFVLSLPSRSTHHIPVYVFVPPSIKNAAAKADPVPVVIDFHGGGFFLGSCLEQAPFCAQVSRDPGVIVLSVDYRLGPIDKFPAALEDAEDVLYAVLNQEKPGYYELRKAIAHELIKFYDPKSDEERESLSAPACTPAPLKDGVNLDTSRIALSGFSSGGNLALELVLSIPIDPPITHNPWSSPFPLNYSHPIPLLLFYPSLDSRLLPSERTRPPNLPATQGFWSELFDVLAPTYLSRDETANPRASPGLADIKDGGLHPQARMLLVLPELDTLSEQSEEWIKKLEGNDRGQHLKVVRYPGMKHGWTQMPVSWLNQKEKQTRTESFQIAEDFVKGVWKTGEIN
jgi:acetyl esterase/lipase